MESKIITLNLKRPKTSEEIRRDMDNSVIEFLMVLVIFLFITICLALFALFTSPASAVEDEPVPTVSAAVTPTSPVVSNCPTPEALVPVQVVEAQKELPAEAPEETQEADPEEVEILALVIYQEAGGDACSDETRRKVGEVALNRVSDPRFPDTLEEVLSQRGQYGRLYWTGLKWPDRASKPGEAHAVDRAYRIAEEVLTSTDRLLPENVIFQAEFEQGTETVDESDGLYFCR